MRTHMLGVWRRGGRDGPMPVGWYATGGDGPEPMGWYDSGGDGPHPFQWFHHAGGTALAADWYMDGDNGDGPTPFVPSFGFRGGPEGPGPLIQIFRGGGSGPEPMVQVFGGGPLPMVQVFGGDNSRRSTQISAGAGAHTSTRLSPPWLTLWNEIKGSIGNDPLVNVATLDQSMNPYVVHITVEGEAKAVAIASVLQERYQFGNVSVMPQVEEKGGGPVAPVIPQSVNDLAQQVGTAFSGNRFYRDVVVKPFLVNSGPLTVYPVFAREVVQFCNDDYQDLYRNYNGVAAAVFKNVLAKSPGGFGLVPSTAE